MLRLRKLAKPEKGVRLYSGFLGLVLGRQNAGEGNCGTHPKIAEHKR